MKKIGLAMIGLFIFGTHFAWADDAVFPWEFPHASGTDALAPRDELGKLHQMARPIPNDFEPRYRCRVAYYFKAPEQLIAQPAYVGALQRDLKRLGYYCGEIDGVWGPDTQDAIARLQKNYSMRVTGTLTDPVRRALHLP
ncbi:MAG: peptidoglycan-binding protein [Verrucomicrobiota bacterium]|nr:peptidoglycan-binding protein [Verrucomicrobiota bacterium]